MFTRQHHKYWPLFMWLFPLLFFAYQFILRLWPSLMMQQIMQQFAIDATSFGILASVYYYGYSGAQIPLAILLDRYGPRHIVFICALSCGFATLIFSYTNSWYFALLGRLLVGVGSAVGFLGVSKVISQWFAKDNYARMIGFTFTIGLMGAIYGGKPVSILVESYSWQKVAAVLACLSIFLGGLTYCFLRSPNRALGHPSQGETSDGKTAPFQFSDFKKLLSSPTIWLLAIANLLMVGSLEGFADVWGVPYLMTAHSLDKSSAAELISMTFVGMLFGGPLLALLSKRFGNYKVIFLCGVGMALIFLQLIFNTTYHWLTIASLIFCGGMMCCYQVLVFAAGADLVSPQRLGVTIAFLNSINMLGGSFFHTLIGIAMDAFWTGTTGDDGVRQYTLESYKAALMIIPICSIAGAGIICFLGFKTRRERARQ